MPFTPFHFGPGLLLKGAAPERLSWSAFVAAQVVIDCETLYHILRRDYPLHRELHTFAGAGTAGLAAAGALLVLRGLLPRGRLAPALAAELSTAPVVLGGLLGGLTHPVLDGLMHADVRPFLPWSEANPLLGLMDLDLLHLGCLAAGLAGAALVWLRCRPRPLAG